MDQLDNLKFFKAKVNCYIHQIKARNIRVSTGGYNLAHNYTNNTWVKDTPNFFHPLSLCVEGKKVFRGEALIKRISLLLDIDIILLKAFNAGLKSLNKDYIPKVKLTEQQKLLKKYFDFGKSIRSKLDKRK